MIGLVLQEAAGHLRDRLSLAIEFCEVQADGRPPATSPEFYIAVHDYGTSTSGSVEGDYIKEEVKLVVTCWFRVAVPSDRIGQLLVWDNRYQDPARQTLDNVCRDVLKELAFNPGRQVFRARLNAIIDAAPTEFGNCFTSPPRYIGMSGPEYYTPQWFDASSKKDVPLFVGRRVQFDGLSRIQSLSIAR